MKKQIIILEIWTDENTRWCGPLRESIQQTAQQVVKTMTNGSIPRVEVYALPKGSTLTISEGDE